MPTRAILAAITLIICLPILFAALGTSQSAGLTIGVVLVVLGIAVGLLGRRR